MIAVTDGFKKFENSKQGCSYVSITPTMRDSGSSVKGRSGIRKVGNGVRKPFVSLFFCSF